MQMAQQKKKKIENWICIYKNGTFGLVQLYISADLIQIVITLIFYFSSSSVISRTKFQSHSSSKW